MMYLEVDPGVWVGFCADHMPEYRGDAVWFNPFGRLPGDIARIPGLSLVNFFQACRAADYCYVSHAVYEAVRTMCEQLQRIRPMHVWLPYLRCLTPQGAFLSVAGGSRVFVREISAFTRGDGTNGRSVIYAHTARGRITS